MSAVLTSSRLAGSWPRALVTLAVLWLSLGVLYADTASAMVWIWIRSETFTHAFLVPPISAWLAWRRKDMLAELQPLPQPWFLVLLVPLMLLWLLGELALVNGAVHLAWVAMLIVCVPAALGWRVAYELTFPLFFLFFAVPIGEFMTAPMMEWTADFTVAAVSLSGVPVYREAQNFVIPSGSWSVVEACSGVRYLIASFMVGTLFAYLNFHSWQRRAAFTVVSIVVPIVANWVRAYGIVMLGHLSGNKIAVGVDHLIYGWVFFGVVIGFMFMLGGRWARREPAAPPRAPVDYQQIQPASAARFLALAVAVMAMALAPRLAMSNLRATEEGRGEPALALPANLGDLWIGEAALAPAVEDRPRFEAYSAIFAKPSTEVRRVYVSDAAKVGVQIAYYRHQNDERKLVTSMNLLAHSGGQSSWNPVGEASAQVDVDGQITKWYGMRMNGRIWSSGQSTPLTVWRSYWIDGSWIASDAEAKLRASVARLLGHGDDGAAIVLWAEGATAQQAASQLERFVRDNGTRLNELLRSVQRQP